MTQWFPEQPAASSLVFLHIKSWTELIQDTLHCLYHIVPSHKTWHNHEPHTSGFWSDASMAAFFTTLSIQSSVNSVPLFTCKTSAAGWKECASLCSSQMDIGQPQESLVEVCSWVLTTHHNQIPKDTTFHLRMNDQPVLAPTRLSTM